MMIERLLFMAWCPVFGASLSSRRVLAGDLLLELWRRLPDQPADRDGQPGLGDATLALRVPVHSG